MKLKVKSYPHPVLGNRDDVSGSAFQYVFTAGSDKEFYYFTVSCKCSNPTLVSLITQEKAWYTIHIECTNTMFRRSYHASSDTFELKIPADDLNGMVEVNGFICARGNIGDYQIEGAHEDYAGVIFPVNKGDILAISDPLVFEAAKDYDSLKKISSLMQIERSSDDAAKAMVVQYELDKIRIILPQADYGMYEVQKKDAKLQHALACSIVLPVLIGAIRILAGTGEDDESFRWQRLIKARLDGLPLQGEDDYIFAAQKILDYPLHRALEGGMAVEEIDSDDDN